MSRKHVSVAQDTRQLIATQLPRMEEHLTTCTRMGSISVKELTRCVELRCDGPEVEVVGPSGVSLAVRPGLSGLATSSVPLRVSLVHHSYRGDHVMRPVVWSTSSHGARKDRLEPCIGMLLHHIP